MNYLAHLFLAQPTVESRVGNLLGDFARGVNTELLPEPILKGLENHRLVDRYTDSHPAVKQLKALVSPQRRRFAGIMLDMAFDHYLIKHWDRFSSQPFEASCKEYYLSLYQGADLMPERMRTITSRIIEQDWFSSYASIEGIGLALDRIAGRIRFQNEFAGSIDELLLLQGQIEQSFLKFFPELIGNVAMQKIEAGNLSS
ncbi:acyl carrier protein phosphodiesterase [Neptuniibacter sp.]|uniref:acyl carrier protein phosphodiesterase n=1 Tax=Neptuniibacter sp. TaxID=1962643 RepID=UPI00262C7454|nr:acyl carrier protein phosphodiesterase [Neptuniibacter sp.]MCP4598024.1 DUF479 domain-containing protein [Neptuniibacter sp.]